MTFPEIFPPVLSRKFTAIVAATGPPLKTYKYCREPVPPLGRWPGVQIHTYGGPAEEEGPGGPAGPAGPAGPVAPVAPSAPAGPVAPVAPVGPVGPIGPTGPGGPVTFQLTRVSLLWQASSAATRRMPPLPGLMQASSTPDGGFEARCAIGTIRRTKARTAKQAMPARRGMVMFIGSPRRGIRAPQGTRLFVGRKE